MCYRRLAYFMVCLVLGSGSKVPFQSESQKKKMQDLVKRGELTQEKYDSMEKATGSRHLPECSSSKVRMIKQTKLSKIIK